jgi:hypothetical protein
VRGLNLTYLEKRFLAMMMTVARPLANLVFALNQAAGVLARRDVLERNIARHRAKQRDSSADQHGHARHDQALNETCPQKSLDGNAAVDVNML